MADIKRPNYFTSQFLVEKDFNDEQAYHLNLRRRHNRVMHTSGVADGLGVTRFSATQVQVASGTAIDKDGREIALEDVRTYTLATVGNNLDVYLTISYRELLDPADQYPDAGPGKFTRTTESPLLQDGTAVPPTDGSVIVLARIHLNATGAIESNTSINNSVRTLVGSKVAAQAVGTGQLADGAVTLAKLAAAVQPIVSIEGIGNPGGNIDLDSNGTITIGTDNANKRIIIGETHSGVSGNPHGTTAQQIDSQGGANRIVTQINAGTGIIAKARVETDMVTGVVTFSSLVLNQEQFSNEIDPGLGAGPLCIQLAFDDLTQTNVTLASDTNYSRNILVRSDVNRSTGRFRIFAMRNLGSPGTVRVRWYAFKPQTGTDATVQVGVAISPPSPALAGNVAQVLTATVSNASSQNVTWSGPETGGGALSQAAATTVTYTSPGVSGTYHVTATSVADPTKSATVAITVNAAITVILSQTTANLIPGQPVTITGDVINTTTKGITWAILNNAGGTLSAASGPSTTFTAPAAPGTYTVVATSVADTTKKTNCVITVTAVAISVSVDFNPIDANTTTTVRATITPAFADNRANWLLQGVGSLSTTQGATTIYTAPGVGATVTVIGTSVADPSKSQSVSITTNDVGGGPGPGPGKLAVIVTDILGSGSVSLAEPATPSAKPAAADAKVRTFITPKKRPRAKAPPEPNDG